MKSSIDCGSLPLQIVILAICIMALAVIVIMARGLVQASKTAQDFIAEVKPQLAEIKTTIARIDKLLPPS